MTLNSHKRLGKHLPLRRLALAGLVAAALSGCGIIPAAVRTGTEVAMLPARVMANSISRDARLMSRTFEQGMTSVGRGMEAGATGLNRSARALSYSVERAATPPIQVHTSAGPRRTGAAPRTVARSTPPRSMSPGAAQTATAATASTAAVQAPVDVPPPQVDILPASVLDELTEDQAGLQRAAQAEAFSAPVGEEIYWEIEGRTGTAMAQSEDAMGTFVCRTFVQTLTLEDDSFTEGEAVMCRNESGVWTASF